MTTAPPAVGTNRDVLRVPGFRRLALAWVFSNFGDSVLFLTAAIWVKQLTGSDAAAGLVFAALGLPALLAPFTGRLADRYRRRPLLIINNLGAGVVVLALLAVRGVDTVWLVYAVIFVYAISSYITAAAQSGLLRDLLDTRLLAPANGILSSIDQGLRIVSPLAGAGMLALWGMHTVVLLASTCFLAAALILATLKLAETVSVRDAGETFWQSTTAGVRFMARHRLLGRALLTLGIAMGATGILNVTVFATVEQGLGKPPEFLSVLLGAQGVMAVLGGLTASLLIRRFGIRRCMVFGVALLAGGVLTTALTVLPLVMAGAAAVGTGASWMIIAFVTLRQEETPPGMQGRTAAVTQVMTNLPQVGASVLAAVLIGILPYQVLVAAMAAASLLAVMPLLSRRARSVGDARGDGDDGGTDTPVRVPERGRVE
ncbi:MFS transporter [Arthrobacter sp. zg-Y1171]|uniref:MFS transporter n=1 Tax=Arthrobacter sp. zg-Y1171 TaxID=2964610 RepID=UPI002102F4D5|nr:MFS transporter [Arthrobacter sp. zg-Y1171]MCQ1995827.1 MFS transporter [Arthrobacter sp. zg-Y1171]UWX83092.1 MFS transporter [Arthrobacter sp. zg-Y1171]